MWHYVLGLSVRERVRPGVSASKRASKKSVSMISYKPMDGTSPNFSDDIVEAKDALKMH